MSTFWRRWRWTFLLRCSYDSDRLVDLIVLCLWREEVGGKQWWRWRIRSFTGDWQVGENERERERGGGVRKRLARRKRVKAMKCYYSGNPTESHKVVLLVGQGHENHTNNSKRAHTFAVHSLLPISLGGAGRGGGD